MKYGLLLLVPVILILAIGCASNTSTTLLDQAAYLKFIGDTDSVTMSIDYQPEVLINPERKKNIVYQYPDGIHVVELFRDGQLIYQKKVILETGKTTEVAIP